MATTVRVLCVLQLVATVVLGFSVDLSTLNCSSLTPGNFTVTQPVKGSGLRLCQSPLSCCTAEVEAQLQQRVRADFQALLHHSSQTVQGLFHTTATTLLEHVTQLASNSENMTLTLFSEAYSRMFSLARTPVTALYSSLMKYLSRAEALPASIPSADAGALQDLVIDFFTQLFPLVYHQAVNLHATDFTDEYKTCLRKNFAGIQPFSDYPHEIAADIAKNFEETKVLLEALLLGADILNTTDSLMASSSSPGLDHCYDALLRLHYCPRCQGLPPSVRPCNGYCLNVMRGCLTLQRAHDLDLPWSNFLTETERLVHQTHEQGGVEATLRTLTTRISDAIMHASINGPLIEKKVKKVCGGTRLVAGSVVPDVRLAGPGASIELPGVTVSSIAHGFTAHSELASQLALFLGGLGTTRARGFYANLADSLCSDPSFADTRDTADCWNGLRVGEYTKELVRPGVDAQKYNPELTWTEVEADPKVRQLSDKLRHMRQVVLSQLSQSNQLISDSFVRGEEGSGSGWQPDDDDGSRDTWHEEGSGSGQGINEDTEAPGGNQPKAPDQPPKEPSCAVPLGGASYLVLSVTLSLVLTRL